MGSSNLVLPCDIDIHCLDLFTCMLSHVTTY
uniref:Uncharacterized protein n=1 Tax=Rhizophora mucronata TaxID=61149 RepID=A0A2P2NRQ0_RHIMU